MAAFGNFAFVLNNLQRSMNNCNNIESYCICWTLSALDYFHATNDTAAMASFAPAMNAKLEHANAIFANLNDQWEFYGWDDRLGGGFSNASTTESQWDYRFLSIRAFLGWADVLDSARSNATGAAHFRAYALSGAAFVRAQLGDAAWFAPGVLGVHAAAEALNTPGFASAAEAAALVATTLNNQATICSQSNFNSYWVLQGLGNGGVLDRGVAMIERCWGSAIALGATCFWEVNTPEWRLFMRDGPSVAPWGYNGNTSLCHPWSAGAAPWLTKNIIGLSPLHPGFAAVLAAPHLTPAMAAAPGGLSGSVPTPHGVVALHVSRARGIELSVPAGCAGGALLRLSEVLLSRLGWLDLGSGGPGLERGLRVLVNGVPETLRAADGDERGPSFEGELAGLRGGDRSRVALLALPPGKHVIVAAAAELLPAPSLVGAPPPFPPLEWPARIAQLDTLTQGQWATKYGSDGYVLWGFKGADARQLPSYVSTIATMDAFGRQWSAPVPDSDPRALQDPQNQSAPRAIGYLESGINELPQYTFGIDIALTPDAEAAGTWFQVSLCRYTGQRAT
jgi:hypothetical protein